MVSRLGVGHVLSRHSICASMFAESLALNVACFHAISDRRSSSIQRANDWHLPDFAHSIFLLASNKLRRSLGSRLYAQRMRPFDWFSNRLEGL